MQGPQPEYKSSPSIRQDIFSFKEDDPRRRRFFICLKMLAILQSHPYNKQLEFNINIKTKNSNFEELDLDKMIYVKPQRIHDELIASHVTCCEHGSPFFSYYHRNLLIYVQMQLNYADQYLRFKDHSQQKQFKDDWKKLMDEYRGIIEDLKQKNIFQEKVMCHYWNPTNYTASSVQNKYVGVPNELLPKRVLQNIDILFEKVNEHLPWNINIRTRFYQLSPQEYRKHNVKQQLSDIFFSDPNTRYNQQERLILTGKSNPRSEDPAMVKHFFDNFIRRASNRRSQQINEIMSNQVSIRNIQYFENQGKGQIMPLYNMDRNEFHTNYGIGVNNHHWIHPNQVKSISAKIGNTRMTPSYYNTLLPHYQFAYAYARTEGSFINNYLGGVSNSSSNSDYQKKMQNSHNTMHNNSCYIMSDPNFSLTNLIFFPYHSWIDYCLQVKIRQLSDTKSFGIAQQQLSYNRERTIYDLLNKDNGPYTSGNYKMVHWVNPRVGAWRWNSSESHQAAKFYFDKNKIDPKKSFRYTFMDTNFQNFVLNEQGQHIRRSDELDQIYKKQYETDSQTNEIFAYFMNLKDYSFNYNYEIFDQGKRIVMDKPNVPVLPSYIQAIVQTLGVRTARLQRPLNTANSSIGNTNIQLEDGNIFGKSLPKKVKQKILQNPIFAIGKYSSLIKSGVYHIQVDFLTKEFHKFNKLISESDMEYIESGFFLKQISIFSKAQGSKTCPKCAPTKKFWVDVADRLRQLFPQIWKALALYFIQKNRVIYVSTESQQQNQQNQIKSNQVLKLSADSQKFTSFNLLQGAQQVEFDVVILNQSIEKQVSLKLDLESFSMFNQRIQGVASKTLYELQVQTSTKHFDFYKMLDVASSSGGNNFDQFDKYYYKKVKGLVIIGETTKMFSFEIPNYHRLIRYLIKLELKQDENQNQMNSFSKDQNKNSNQAEEPQSSKTKKAQQSIFVEIQDKDHDVKWEYYQNWIDDL